MVRTPQQIETDITNNVKLDIMEYVKDYAAKIINANTDKINSILQDIYNHVNGIDVVVGHLGKPLSPAASDPSNPNDYDWYFNTTSREFRMYHNGWTTIATLSGAVDLTGYYTKTETDGKFATKTELGNVTIDAYTKAESDARYEHASLDFTASPLTWTESSQGGHNYIILDRPAAAATTLVGGLNKIKIQAPSSPLTHADAQVTYATDLIFINKAAGNIMTYDEITTEVAAGKILVIKKIAQGEWEFVRWELPAGGGAAFTETLRVVFKDGTHKDFKTGGV